ncbi:hypothetical protein OF83DRAFT_1153971, partial [Amylostereum chailletii]
WPVLLKCSDPYPDPVPPPYRTLHPEESSAVSSDGTLPETARALGDASPASCVTRGEGRPALSPCPRDHTTAIEHLIRPSGPLTEFELRGWRTCIGVGGFPGYFYHTAMHIVADMDLRSVATLDSLSEMLDGTETIYQPPSGWELWLCTTPGHASTETVKPIQAWINHRMKWVSFTYPDDGLPGVSHGVLSEQHREKLSLPPPTRTSLEVATFRTRGGDSILVVHGVSPITRICYTSSHLNGGERIV